MWPSGASTPEAGPLRASVRHSFRGSLHALPRTSSRSSRGSAQPAAEAAAVNEITADALFVEQFEQLLARRDSIAVKLLRNLSRALAKELAETNEVYADLAVWVI